MNFSSTIFVFAFFPIVLLIYYAIPKKLKNLWLLIVSILFYSFGQLNYLWLLLISIVIDFMSALIIDKLSNGKYCKLTLITCIVFHLIMLYIFKYFNFTFNIVNSLFKFNLAMKNIILPIGISFYTFQGMSYVGDVYRKDVKAQKSFIKLATYITMFPQLVAGPIVRYKDIEKDLYDRKITLDNIVYGIKKFVIGFAKKIILADSLGLVVTNIYNLDATDLTSSIAWFAALCYTLQIYFDFSGYSDMAIGMGKMLGFEFPENFKLPYMSKSITEFWRRWHITLSTWFKDYVYIPLGGNRKHHLRNIMIIFLLTGIWHGAGLTFIVWGIWHGFFSVLEKMSKKYFINIKINNFIKYIYTLLVVIIGWVIFRSENLTQVFTFLKAMFSNSVAYMPGYDLAWFLTKYNLFIFVVGVFACTPLPSIIYKKITNKLPFVLKETIERLLIIFLLMLAIFTLVSSNYHPFIYFQF